MPTLADLRTALQAGAALLLAGCAATSNPDPASLRAVAPEPVAEPVSAQPAPDPGQDTRQPTAAPRQGAGEAPTPAEQEPPAAAAAPGSPAQAEVAPARLAVGTVGGEAIDVREFLSQLWMRDADRARELLDFLVLSRIALFEADRLGVRIDPALVDAKLEEVRAALRARLEKSGSQLSMEEHVRRKLEMDLADYERKLRADAVVQLLTERCMRAWYLGNPRVDLRLMEIPDEPALETALAELEAGKSFEEVARAHAVDSDAAQGGTRVTVVRSDASNLSRLGFSTPVGEVAGPLAQGGRFLLLRPEARFEAQEGPWTEVGPAVEQSLKETPVDADRMEFVQWRTAMMRRYAIDLDAFLALVLEPTP